MKKKQKNKTIAIAYDAFADIGGGVIAAFVLYKMYTHFLAENKLVFALLLFLGCIGGLYNFVRKFL